MIRELGEERQATRVARAIVAGRPWSDTRLLAQAIASTIGGRPGRIHPATRTFQAIRIVVNDELGELRRLLDLMLIDQLKQLETEALAQAQSGEDPQALQRYKSLYERRRALMAQQAPAAGA